jgi:hypothetical protein
MEPVPTSKPPLGRYSKKKIRLKPKPHLDKLLGSARVEFNLGMSESIEGIDGLIEDIEALCTHQLRVMEEVDSSRLPLLRADARPVVPGDIKSVLSLRKCFRLEAVPAHRKAPSAY